MPAKPIDATLARARAAKAVYIYLSIQRYGREPYAWELAVANALLAGQLSVTSPPDNAALCSIHHLVDGVELALALPDLATEETAE